jgi:Cu+-exporting ATPase
MTMTKDPACGKMIEQSGAAESSEYEGIRYYFCSERCREAFTRNPAAYVAHPDGPPRPPSSSA